MFDVFYIGQKPNQFVHEREVQNIEEAQSLSRTRYFWIIHYLCDYSEFDFLWEPKPWESHQRHAFSSQWQKDSETYLCPAVGYSDTNYHSDIVIYRKEDLTFWDNTTFDFDYSWHPDPTEPLMNYQFGTQWQKTGGPKYIIKDAVATKYVNSPRVVKKTVDKHWTIPNGINDFDYTWHPDNTEPPFVYQFGTQWQKTGGPTYTVPGATIIKYESYPRATKTGIDNNWVVPENVGDFDYTWHPDNSEPPMNYQFGTQWQKTGGPLYVQDGATETKYVSQIYVKNIAISKEVYLIDHGNAETQLVKQQLESKGLTVKKISRFISSYKGTLQRVLSQENNEFVWVCSSVCDYNNFDFSWHPEQWQGTMLHVFASENEKFGDTFLINTTSFNSRIINTELLEWYDTIHFVDNINVPRWPIPIVVTDGNSIVDAVKEHTFLEPLTLFSDQPVSKIPTVPLWREKTRTIIPLSTGNSVVVVPRDAKTHVFEEMYDYPYINKTYSGLLVDKPLDVVFFSNGEKNAEKNWERLQQVLSGKPNKLIWIKDVNGRLAANRACADASSTEWFFSINAKLYVDDQFDWNWQPDRMQKNKHYIFHAYNLTNGLQYGHMAAIAWNKKLVNTDTNWGLDFTMSHAHEVVPVLSGIGDMGDNPWDIWRTSFREVLKLIYYNSIMPNVENDYRIEQWKTVGVEWSLVGARDAQEYFNLVDGIFEKIKLSYEWDWLREYFRNRYEIN